MNIDSFFAHYRLQQNPFDAEEARLDPVFARLDKMRLTHPDFAKILGQIDQASTSIVFGEKGSGKTAIRLMISQRVDEHNRQHPDRRSLVVPYDDLNPVLDKIMRSHRQKAQAVLHEFRLEDHQDAILSRAITPLVSTLTGQSTGDSSADAMPLPQPLDPVIRNLSRQNRVDLAVLAALYDQPRTGSVVDRWRSLRKTLRLGWRLPMSWLRLLATALTIVVAGLLIAWFFLRGSDEPTWLVPVLGLSIAAAVLMWGYWGWRQTTLWWLCRRIQRETPTVERTVQELHEMLGDLSPGERARQPFPVPAPNGESAGDARYQLTRRLTDLLRPFGYVAVLVLVDRVDEPTLISGNAERMKAVVWPMFDNKFLQQDGVGLKLLLPIELRHLLHRESPEFYQEARLDKQNMIDRLTWSGTTLYDLCTARLRACQTDHSPAGSEPVSDDAEPTTQTESSPAGDRLSLTDLFEPAVSREMLIDALDQMHQPRDAFKFLYQVIQEHCRLIPEEQADYKVARLTLETVRKQQSQRVQELYRGLTPA